MTLPRMGLRTDVILESPGTTGNEKRFQPTDKLSRMVLELVKVARKTTFPLGIVKTQGSVEQDTFSAVDQAENHHPEEGVAETVTDEPTASEQPLGQLGLTEPEPDATFVVNV
ncbi:MAG: hypothetical protein ABSF82_14820 [Candidatus Bathyarchaeia archaeon]